MTYNTKIHLGSDSDIYVQQEIDFKIEFTPWECYNQRTINKPAWKSYIIYYINDTMLFNSEIYHNQVDDLLNVSDGLMNNTNRYSRIFTVMFQGGRCIWLHKIFYGRSELELHLNEKSKQQFIKELQNARINISSIFNKLLLNADFIKNHKKITTITIEAV